MPNVKCFACANFFNFHPNDSHPWGLVYHCPLQMKKLRLRERKGSLQIQNSSPNQNS